MGYLLCMGKLAIQPYILSEIGLGIYSVEELCYYIYHNPSFLQDDFFSDSLLLFLEKELDLVELSKGLLVVKKSGYSLEEQLIYFLKEVHYYSEEEIKNFIKKLEQLKKTPLVIRLSQKADWLRENEKYAHSIPIYESIIEKKKETNVPIDFYYNIWEHLGDCYLHVMLYEKAYDCYVQAYHNALKRLKWKIYVAKAMCKNTQNSDFSKEIFTEEELLEMDKEYSNERKNAELYGKRITEHWNDEGCDWKKEVEKYLKDKKKNYVLS